MQQMMQPYLGSEFKCKRLLCLGPYAAGIGSRTLLVVRKMKKIETSQDGRFSILPQKNKNKTVTQTAGLEEVMTYFLNFTWE